MNGKTVIVTGANGGIGEETAKALAKQGARVIMACRNLETGRQVRENIVKATGNENVVLKRIDLSSQQSIRDFAKHINKTEPQLDVVIHNAGVWLSKSLTNEDGLEMTMATNHFGPFLLTHLLIDLLKRSAPSRIIVVSSVSHHFGILNVDKSSYSASYIPQWNYFNSKLANIYFTRELAHRLQGSNITVNSVHPGLIDTGIWNSIPAPFSWLLKLISKILFKSCEEGCQTIVYLAVSEDVANVTGKYFVNLKRAYMSPKALNENNCKRLWAISEKIVKLNADDPKI